MCKRIAAVSAKRATEIAAAYAGIEPAEVREITGSCLEGGLYDVSFCGDWMSYECYLDAVSGEVRGFFSEPLEL